MFEIIVLLLVVQVIGIIFLDSKVSNIQGILEGIREEMQKKTTIINVREPPSKP